MTPQKVDDELARHDTAFVDAFRGVAAFWVVAGHCQLFTGYPLIPYPSARQAVDLFMLLSGFLMVLTIDRRRRQHGSAQWRAFYIRRAFRIAPVYYAALLLLWMVWPHHADGFAYFRSLYPERWPNSSLYDSIVLDGKNILLHVTFLFGLSPDYSFSTLMPDWSLAIEAQFYAAFPLLYWIMRRGGRWSLFALAVAAIAATHGYAVAVQQLGWSPFREPTLLFFKLEIFIVGMLIYDAGRAGFKPLPLLLGSGLLLLSYHGVGLTALAFLGSAGLFAAIWLCPPHAAVGMVARSRIVRFAADCSYPVYLVHGFALSLVGAPLMKLLLAKGYPPGAAATAVTLSVIVLSYVASYGVHHAIERPGIKVGALIAARLVPRRNGNTP